MTEAASLPVDPDLRAGERESLTQFLDFYRATIVRLAGGLTKEQLASRLPPSDLTLAGLLKHLALVEDAWFVETFRGDPMPEPWASVDWDADPDWEFRTAPDDEPADLVGRYETASARAREIVAAAPSLDTHSVGLSRRPGTAGEPFSLRWILLHMIEETARHAGHADLIRQSIDGATDL